MAFALGSGGICSVRSAELAVVPGGSSLLDELQAYPLDRLGVDGGQGLWGKLGRGVCASRDGVASQDLRSECGDLVDVAVDYYLALEHYSA